MDYARFYEKLFAPLTEVYGPISTHTLVPIIGFDAGGPLSFCQFEQRLAGAMTYVSCELAVRPEQRVSELGRYELLATSNDEGWVRSTLSDIGRESFETSFGDGHTLDIGAWAPDEFIQGVVFEEACAVSIDHTPFAVFRCMGVSRSELEFARVEGVPRLVALLQRASVYPRTASNRTPVA